MQRKIDPGELELANARLDATVTALRDVMRTLRHAAGSPEEQQVYARAREVLALSGRVEDAEAAVYQAAYEEWARQRCEHTRWFETMPPVCMDCGKVDR